MKFFKKIATYAMAAIMVLTTIQPMQAAAARTVTVFRVDGEAASIHRNGARHTTARQRTRITAGDELVTGRATQVYLNMDGNSLLKVDSESRVAFELTSGLIGLTVAEGNALVRVAEQASGQSLESRVGNVIHAVRGTMFTIGHFNENIVYIAMLSGSGEVGGVMLEEGQILTSWHEGDELDVSISGAVVHDLLEDGTNIVISEIVINELDQFTLQEIWDNQEYLLENSGFVTVEVLEEVLPFIVVSPAPTQNQPPPQNNVDVWDVENDFDDSYWNDGGDGGYWVGIPDVGDGDGNGDGIGGGTGGGGTGSGSTGQRPPSWGIVEPPLGADGFYIISEFAHLQWIANFSIAANGYLGLNQHFVFAYNMNFRLANDIVIPEGVHFGNLRTARPFTTSTGSAAFTSIFTGIFDGAGHAIRNFSGTSFFTNLDGATIKNLTIYGNVNAFNAGGVVNTLQQSTNDILIENVHFVGNVTTNGQYAGGIVGGILNTSADVTISNVSFTGNVTNNNPNTGQNPAGGIVGLIVGGGADNRIVNIRNASFVGGVTSNSPSTNATAAGIVGHFYSNNPNSSIENVMVVGSIVSPNGARAAGIASTSAQFPQISINNGVVISSLIQGAEPGIGGNGRNTARAIRRGLDSFQFTVLPNNIFAHENIQMIPIPTPNLNPSWHDISNIDGQDVTTAQLLDQLWWEANLNFDFTNVWQWNPGALPTLQGSPATPPTIPAGLAFSPFAAALDLDEIEQEGHDIEFWDIDLDDLLTLTPEFDVVFPEIDLEFEDDLEFEGEEEEDEFPNLDDLLTPTPEIGFDDEGNPIVVHPPVEEEDDEDDEDETDKKENEEDDEIEDEDDEDDSDLDE
ncbi:MAG: hypothetical protein FWG65_04915 [Turicibacter sp.]|nr:hypothetical protein [Turicibacter sp.]